MPAISIYIQKSAVPLSVNRAHLGHFKGASRIVSRSSYLCRGWSHLNWSPLYGSYAYTSRVSTHLVLFQEHNARSSAGELIVMNARPETWLVIFVTARWISPTLCTIKGVHSKLTLAIHQAWSHEACTDDGNGSWYTFMAEFLRSGDNGPGNFLHGTLLSQEVQWRMFLEWTWR